MARLPRGDQDGRDHAERIAAHDEAIDGLQRSMTALEDGQNKLWDAMKIQGSELSNAMRAQGSEMRHELSKINDSINKARVFPWPVVVSGMGVAVTVIGGIWGLGVSPLREGQKSLDGRLDHAQQSTEVRLDRISEMVQRASIKEAAMQEKLAEVETQFRESRNIKNMHVQHGLILLNDTRRECGLAPYDMPTFWPAPNAVMSK